MPIATSTALLVGGLAAAGSVAGGLVGSSAAKSAAQTQANAAEAAAQAQLEATKYSTDAQAKAAADALAFEKEVQAQNQANLAPWLQAGSGQINTLSQMLQNGSFVPWNKTFQSPGAFQAPTLNETNDPGYAFRLQQGQQALERAAAAKGTVYGGATGKALSRYSQDYASNEYNNVYNRALATSNTNYSRAASEYERAYNEYRQNQADEFNRRAVVAGIGQTAAGQLTGSNLNAANQVSNTLTGTAQSIGNTTMQGTSLSNQDLLNAANARASGYVGSANAFSNTLSGGVNSLQNVFLLSKLFPGTVSPVNPVDLSGAASYLSNPNVFVGPTP